MRVEELETTAGCVRGWASLFESVTDSAHWELALEETVICLKEWKVHKIWNNIS